MNPLIPVHPDETLIPLKLQKYRKLSTDDLIRSLAPGQEGSLKTRPDGTMLDGHHRIRILRERGIDVDALPREVIPKTVSPDLPERVLLAMTTEPFWIPGPWTGRLAIAPRPRGHDWLEDELRHWRRSGVDGVVSLLTDGEIASFGLEDEEKASRDAGMEFDHYPIEDRSIPPDPASTVEGIARIESRLRRGRSVLVHCRQGIGRAATIAIAVLIHAGTEIDDAIAAVAQARGRPVPETPEQLRWLREYAETVAPATAK